MPVYYAKNIEMDFSRFGNVLPFEEDDVARLLNLSDQIEPGFVEFFKKNNGIELCLIYKDDYALADISSIQSIPIVWEKNKSEFKHMANYILISYGPTYHEEFYYKIRGNQARSVFLLDHSNEVHFDDESFEGKGVTHLTSSFDDFVKNLYYEE
ncbi:hypothetical protein PsAD2_03705 [Pseudovibrio axinellae]|uniref:SMI1 / KNR4 family protein n=1 Tax=Pseudovibrio axinellae TaxID=989403 RepID=A0A165VU66_9HYPH|nr:MULTISPECIES: hypothetical protein [Pseudovibrio]KZL15449.1 hypothetical protein PsAD2_03705 [Pseudovibrio axinellae]KZL15687.1 hypothetical protein PsAD37_04296 [Pseudovibrio sp. Ad37]SER89059.1 hypothetical protein SAMN05421798_1522 [Pseudovibrio axinellae]